MPDPDSTEPLAHRRTLRTIIKRNPAYQAGAAIVLGIGLIALLTAIFKPDREGGYWIALGAVAIVPFLAIPIAISLRGKPSEAEATAEGLAWRDRNGNHFRAWGDVVQVFRIDLIMDKNAEGHTTVIFNDGSRVVLDQSLTDYELLAHEVQHRAADALMPATRAAVQAGPVEFGPVTLRRDGVIVNTRFFPLEKVKFFNVQYGRLLFEIVSPDRPWSEDVKLGDVPNYLVVMTLLGEMGVSFGPPKPPAATDVRETRP